MLENNLSESLPIEHLRESVPGGFQWHDAVNCRHFYAFFLDCSPGRNGLDCTVAADGCFGIRGPDVGGEGVVDQTGSLSLSTSTARSLCEVIGTDEAKPQ
ncbi:hypothetical protein [Arthrobacter sp. K5]|uniref:Uncharacterized protein n=1 Tax=Arthrobacter sp. K5 TaxID=2839623 RepID=A0AAU8EKT8_9MICC